MFVELFGNRRAEFPLINPAGDYGLGFLDFEFVDLASEKADFEKCDLRVCKILSAKPMRKTNKLMKLTLHDGAGERVIVSSIADLYMPEQLVGRKIVVLVNLKPHKFGNEYSDGMLIASGNSDGTCRVLFAADDAEIGSLVY